MPQVNELVTRLLDRDRERGELCLEDGTRLVEPAPDIAPKAWRHIAFSALTETEIRNLEQSLHFVFSPQFRNFLLEHNGLSLGGRQIEIWGNRKSWDRLGVNIWQPFDIVDHNRGGARPAGSPHRAVYFGSTDRGSQRVFFVGATRYDYQVGKTTCNVFEPHQLWPDFDSWLSDEIRLLFERA